MESIKNNWTYISIILLLITGLILDLLSPLGIAAGIAYLPAVLISMHASQNKYSPLTIATICCIMVNTTAAFTIPETLQTIYVINRILTTLALISTGFVGNRIKNVEFNIKILFKQAPIGKTQLIRISSELQHITDAIEERLEEDNNAK